MSVPFTLAELNLRGRSRSVAVRWAKSVQLAVAAFVLPQVSAVLWWLQTHSWIHLRGFINIEYLVLLAIGLVFPSRITVAALTAELTIALVEPLAHLYYFSPADAIRSLVYLKFVPPHLLLAYSVVILVYIAGCFLFLQSALAEVPRFAATALTAGLLVLIVFAWSYDLLSGHLRPMHVSTTHGDADLRTPKLVRSPVASLVYATFLMGRGTVAPSSPVAIASALRQVIAQEPSGSKPDIVLVLTESWGLAIDPHVNAAEMMPYRSDDIAQRYTVKTGTVRFYGSTTSGETRELCGDALGRWGKMNDPGRHGSCIPEQLRRDGYTTLAVHGFTPTMYNRDLWYPKLGFSEEAFLPQMQRYGAKICNGAFPGACDSDVARWIGDRLGQQSVGAPIFIHWVTLNSHLPVAEVPGVEADTNCHNLGISDHGSLCAWFNRVLEVHRSVAALAERPRLRPTIFVIVGDHAPPFVSPDVRNRFSQSEVPWVALIPKRPDAAKMFAGSGTQIGAPRTVTHALRRRHQRSSG